MKLGQATKLDKRNKTTSKKFDDHVMSGNCDTLLFFQFTDNLEQSGSQVPDTQSVKLIFSITVTFYLTKTESRIKKPLTQLPHYCFD